MTTGDLRAKAPFIISLLATGSLLLAACSPTPTSTPVRVVETQIVEKVVTRIVERIVTLETERVVEKIVEVTPTPAPHEEKITLNWNLGEEPSTLDPALAGDKASVACVENLFLGLTDLHPATNEVVPELATEWTVSKDGLVWTFTMRRDARWVRYRPGTGEVADVGPVTAHDVVYGVRRALNPSTASQDAYVLYVIKGAEAFNTVDRCGLSQEDSAALEQALGVRALDDYTVEFTLEHPADYFGAIASMWVARPQPKDVIEAKGDRWIEPGFIVTNGPYVLVDWIHDDSMIM